MAETEGKGTWPNKALIAILLAILAVLVIYPRALHEAETERRELCRYRLTNLYHAAQQFQQFRHTRPESLEEILTFVKYDSAYQRALDEIIASPLRETRKLLGALQQKQRSVDTLLTMTAAVSRDTLYGLQEHVIHESRELRARMESIREDLARLPAQPVAEFDCALEIIERKDFFLNLEIVQRSSDVAASHDNAVIALKENIANLDSIDYHIGVTLQRTAESKFRLEALTSCPTVFRPYLLEWQENAGHGLCKFSCPIDERDVEIARRDVLKYRIGVFVIANHGFIHAQGKSWHKEG